jgi:hypothetical protein
MVIELLFMGAAWHKDPGMNNVNPGLGIMTTFAEERLLDFDGTLQSYGGLAVYRDSYSDTAILGGVGARAVLGNPLAFHYGPDLFVGYRSAKVTPGPIAIPSLYAGYGSLNLHIAAMGTDMDAFGAFLRYEVKIP